MRQSAVAAEVATDSLNEYRSGGALSVTCPATGDQEFSVVVSNTKERQRVASQGGHSPASKREIEAALASDINVGLFPRSDTESVGSFRVKLMRGTRRAILDLGVAQDDRLGVKELTRLVGGRAATSPRGKILLAVPRINPLMKLPCRLDEAMELLRGSWQELECITQQIFLVATSGNSGLSMEEVCRDANRVLDRIQEEARRLEHDQKRHRRLQVERNFAAMSNLLDGVLEDEEEVRVVTMEFALSSSVGLSTAPGPDLLLRELVHSRGRFLDCLRSSPVMSRALSGYVWHLSYDFEAGPFLRFYFLLKAGELGGHEKFVARAGRLWSRLTQGLGVLRQGSDHFNPLVRVAQGVIRKASDRRVSEVKKALWYEAMKEEVFRISMPKGQRAFGMSAVKKDASDVETYRSKNLMWVQSLSRLEFMRPESVECNLRGANRLAEGAELPEEGRSSPIIDDEVAIAFGVEIDGGLMANFQVLAGGCG